MAGRVSWLSWVEKVLEAGHGKLIRAATSGGLKGDLTEANAGDNDLAVVWLSKREFWDWETNQRRAQSQRFRRAKKADTFYHWDSDDTRLLSQNCFFHIPPIHLNLPECITLSWDFWNYVWLCIQHRAETLAGKMSFSADFGLSTNFCVIVKNIPLTYAPRCNCLTPIKNCFRRFTVLHLSLQL